MHVIWAIIRSGKINRTPSAGLVASLLFVPFLGGCLMHSLGHGPRAEMPASPAAGHQTTLLQKEVQRDDITATLEVPPLRAGKESWLVVKLHNSRSGTPIRQARVSIGVVSLQDRTSEQSAPHGDTITVAAREDSDPGVYSARCGFEEIGPVEIVAEIDTSDEWARRPLLVVQARQDVFSDTDSMSRRTRIPLFVIGTVGMLVMMAAFML